MKQDIERMQKDVADIKASLDRSGTSLRELENFRLRLETEQKVQSQYLAAQQKSDNETLQRRHRSFALWLTAGTIVLNLAKWYGEYIWGKLHTAP